MACRQPVRQWRWHAMRSACAWPQLTGRSCCVESMKRQAKPKAGAAPVMHRAEAMLPCRRPNAHVRDVRKGCSCFMPLLAPAHKGALWIRSSTRNAQLETVSQLAHAPPAWPNKHACTAAVASAFLVADCNRMVAWRCMRRACAGLQNMHTMPEADRAWAWSPLDPSCTLTNGAIPTCSRHAP